MCAHMCSRTRPHAHGLLSLQVELYKTFPYTHSTTQLELEKTAAHSLQPPLVGIYFAGEMEAAAAAASYVTDVENLKATELRLGLPGTEEPAQKKVAVVPTPPSTPRGNKRALAGEESAREEAKKCDGQTAPPAAKAQVVGWPPVRTYRKSCFQASSKSKAAQQEEAATAAPAAATAAGSGLYVKVSMDGAPYLRKIDLKMYKGYRELREALEAMFLCFPGGADNGGVNPSDFAVTYEDKDGDLMLVGDVPFEMFISTCKRLRIMKGSEARGLGSSRE